MKTILLSALMLATLVGCGNEDYSKAISDNESRLDAIESNMDKRLDAIESNLDERLDAIESLLGNNKSRLDDNESRLDKRLGSIESLLDDNESRLNDIDSEVENNYDLLGEYLIRMDTLDRRDNILKHLIMTSFAHDDFADFTRVVTTAFHAATSPNKDIRPPFNYEVATTFALEAERYIHRVLRVRPDTDISRAAEEVVNKAKEYKAAIVWEEDPDYWKRISKTKQQEHYDVLFEKYRELMHSMNNYLVALVEDYTPPKDEDDDGIVA